MWREDIIIKLQNYFVYELDILVYDYYLEQMLPEDRLWYAFNKDENGIYNNHQNVYEAERGSLELKSTTIPPSMENKETFITGSFLLSV